MRYRPPFYRSLWWSAFFSLFLASSQAQAWGEIEEGYPLWQEILQLVLTNRVRQDTARAKKDYHNPNEPKNLTWENTDYPPCPPMVYHQIVGKAARLHSQDMDVNNYFSHDGQDGSSPTDRVERQLGSRPPTGENIANGYATAERVTIGWLNSDGHRENIFTCSWTQLGVGHSKINKDNWTQNFVRINLERPLIHAAIHFPQFVKSTEDANFYANYYHAGGQAPQEIKVVIDGRCYDMRLEYGKPANGNYEAKVELPKGCHPYYFRVRKPDGGLEIFPTRGSYLVGVDQSCNGLFQNTQKEAQCDAGCTKNEECAAHQECKESRCIDTKRCKNNIDCPTATSCRDGHCQPDNKLWDACKAPTACPAALACLPHNGASYCSVPCQKYIVCPHGFACDTTSGDGLCIPHPACQTDTDCAAYHNCKEGKCVDRPPCASHADCPQGTMCKDTLCISPGTLGVACQGLRDCDTGSQCIPWQVDGERKAACGFSCTDDTQCPKGSSCKPFGPESYCFGKPELPPPPPPKKEEPPPQTGGCNHLPQPSQTPFLWFALFLLALSLRRR